jgi:hypothetical protein
MLAQPNPTPNRPKPPKPSLQRIAAALQTAGWLGFWAQFGLALTTIVLLLIAIPGALFGENASQGISFAMLWAIAAVGVAGFSTSLSFRYTRIARRLLGKDRGVPQPRKGDTLQLLKVGLYVALAGMAIALIGSGISMLVLVAKAVSQPPGATISDTTKIVRPLDVFVALANLSASAANFVGLLVSLWLSDRLEGPSNNG